MAAVCKSKWQEITSKNELRDYLDASLKRGTEKEVVLILLDPKCSHCSKLWDRLCKEGSREITVAYMFVNSGDKTQVASWLKEAGIGKYPEAFPHSILFRCRTSAPYTSGRVGCTQIDYSTLERMMFPTTV